MRLRRRLSGELVSRWIVATFACLSYPSLTYPSTLEKAPMAFSTSLANSFGADVTAARFWSGRLHHLRGRTEKLCGRRGWNRPSAVQCQELESTAGSGGNGHFQWRRSLLDEVDRISQGMCMKSKLLLADIHAPIQRVEDRDLSAAGVELFLKREDLIDPEISGNKWRKVKYNALKALAQPRPCGLVTFGGSFSNHVAATAAVGARLGLKTFAFIRGEELADRPFNPTLARAAKHGMSFRFLTRAAYREATRSLAQQEELAASVSTEDLLLLPEGGSNDLGLYGCAEILGTIPHSDVAEFDVIATACGTGATMAGLAASVTSILPEGSRRPIVLGFPALKGGEFLADDATRLLRKCADPGSVIAAQAIFSLETAFHLGGYGKTPPELLAFMQTFPPPVPHQEAPLLRTFRLCHITHAVPHLGVPCRFYERTHVKLDPVYTSKMIFGIYEMAKAGRLRNKRVLAIHTGGLQGISATESRLGVKIFS